MEEKRYHEINERLKNSSFRFRWCEGGACACSGCVNMYERSVFLKDGINPPTREEWLEWALGRALLEKGIATEHLKDLTNQKQQKKIPTIQEFYERLALIERAKTFIKLTDVDY